jgi:hypothetical protein
MATPSAPALPGGPRPTRPGCRACATSAQVRHYDSRLRCLASSPTRLARVRAWGPLRPDVAADLRRGEIGTAWLSLVSLSGRLPGNLEPGARPTRDGAADDRRGRSRPPRSEVWCSAALYREQLGLEGLREGDRASTGLIPRARTRHAEPSGRDASAAMRTPSSLRSRFERKGKTGPEAVPFVSLDSPSASRPPYLMGPSTEGQDVPAP